jgi:hypothetical protein
MAGCAGFIGMPGKLAGPRIGTKARHGGKQVFETTRLAIGVAWSPAAESLRDGSASLPAFRGSSRMSANPKSMYTRHDKYPM